jgi:DNA-binding PadR family transcriptional regulator
VARIRRTRTTLAVLDALAEDPKAWHHGYDLLTKTGLQSGSLYPILMRLAARGYLEATWEHDPPTGRPARHLYRLSSAGRQLAREQVGITNRATVALRTAASA